MNIENNQNQQVNANNNDKKSHKGMFKCPKCKQYMEKYATTCPNCDWKNYYYKKPFGDNQKMGIGGILSIVFITLAVYYLFNIDTKTLKSQNAQINNNENSIVANDIDISSYDVEVTLKELYDEFSKNQVRGNKEYMNKRIKITAPINKIETEYAGVLTVILDASKNDGKAQGSWSEITLKENKLNCFAVFDFKDGNDDGITNYNVGDTITLIGKLKYANGNTLGFYESKIVQ